MDSTDTRFFTALDRLCSDSTDVPEACRDAVAKAAETQDPLDMRDAREAIHALDDALRTRILRQVFMILATDLPAIWDMMPTAPGTGRPN